MAFEFPFALAARAVDEMEATADRLRAVIATHDGALAAARVDFEGVTREQFDTDITDALDALRSHASVLDGDAMSLRTTIALARQLEAMNDEHDG